jgi:hypothetical protein
MTQEEFNTLSDTDRAFLKLEGRCAGCGCALNGMFIAHSSWCSLAPRIIFNPGHEWGKHSTHHVTKSARMGKSVFANMVNELNKIFGKTYENTNS